MVLSTTVPLIELEFVETSPAWSVGFRRYCPFPSWMTDAQASKSMLMSVDWLAAMVMAPPEIRPGGILMPVCASLLNCSSWGVPPLGTTQLKPAVQTLPDGPEDALLARSSTRICWYDPGGKPLVEPNWVRMQVVEARLSKSICLGLLVRSSSVTHPLSESPAVAEMFAETLVMVTHTFENGPPGAAQLGGSLRMIVALPVEEAGAGGALFPPQLIHTPTARVNPARRNHPTELRRVVFSTAMTLPFGIEVFANRVSPEPGTAGQQLSMQLANHAGRLTTLRAAMT